MNIQKTMEKIIQIKMAEEGIIRSISSIPEKNLEITDNWTIQQYYTRFGIDPEKTRIVQTMYPKESPDYQTIIQQMQGMYSGPFNKANIPLLETLNWKKDYGTTQEQYLSHVVPRQLEDILNTNITEGKQEMKDARDKFISMPIPFPITVRVKRFLGEIVDTILYAVTFGQYVTVRPSEKEIKEEFANRTYEEGLLFIDRHKKDIAERLLENYLMKQFMEKKLVEVEKDMMTFWNISKRKNDTT